MNKHKKFKGFCQCDKLTPGTPGAPGTVRNLLERFLLWLVPHFDIIKTVPSCETCKGTGFDPRKTSPSLGDYDRICDECAGQSVYQPTITTLYLRRFYIFRSEWFGVNWGDLYIHKIYRSDDDPDPHDHPWDFRTWVLAGSYLNEVWAWDQYPRSWNEGPGQRLRLKGMDEVLKTGMTRFRYREHVHRVILTDDKPAWTLVKTSSYRRNIDDDPIWYFITPKGPVFWREYLKLTSQAKYGG